MGVDELANLVIDKFKQCGGYIEIEEDKMKQAIQKHLGKIYKFEMEYTMIKLEHDRTSGKPITKQNYVDEFRLVETKVINEAERIAVSSRTELQHFV